MAASPVPFPDHVMFETVRWAHQLGSDWEREAPIRIHDSTLAADGTHEWHPDFEKWLIEGDGRGSRNSSQRLRTTKVMRRLRRVAVREYEVLYRVLVLHERLEETTVWLNDRAERNSIPFPPHRPDGPHYIRKDALALFICGIDFARQYLSD